MVQPKPKRLWQPSELETRVAGKARQAFAFWVRAIEDAEGDVPQSLARATEKRCPGSSEFAADRKRHHSDSPLCFWSYLEEWIHERIFGKMRREGWMNAVGYYAARDLASLRNHAYWDYCERQWKCSKPATYPSFREWLKASDDCPDQILDDYGIRGPGLPQLSRTVSFKRHREGYELIWLRTSVPDRCPITSLFESQT